jgi:RHS repeat-associated protein
MVISRVAASAGCVFALLVSGFVHAQQSGSVTYIYTDSQGTPLAETDAQGNITATFDYTPYGTVAMGTSPSGPGYTGHVNDPETNLVYMQGRYYDSSIGQFLSIDPKQPKAGDSFSFGRYTYVHDNPINNVDPDGRDCASSGRTTTCFTAVYRVSFETQPGFKDFTSASPNYHFYTVPASTPGMTKAQDQSFLVQHPTPGYPQAATPQGTPNDATPYVGGISLPITISPVKSFTTINQLDGQPVVVNVTESGHPLASGIVVREAIQSSDGSTSIQNWGEGTSSLQGPGSPVANDINNVWQTQTPANQTQSSPLTTTGCGSGMMNACSR